VASIGGTAGNGTVFALNTDGTGFTNLHSFTATSGSLATNSDGARPRTGLILSDNTLYGVAMFGGIAGYGTVFALNTDGTGFTNLHTFTASGYSDGRSPSGLILAGSTLYGTASDGGGGLSGTVFGLNTDGTGFANLHSFAMSYSGGQSITNTDGSSPSGLTLSGNALYGTAGNAGDWGNGTVFSISFPPQLTISASAGNVILTWPTNFAGFDYTGYKLQSTTNLLSPLWNTNLPPPVVVNGQRTVTNPISGIRKFFRLSQ
jgi:uncharacterized repeat protein (TIGR03803 family)